MFDFQPNLIGNLVSCRPLEKSDYEGLYEVAKDPLIWEQHPVKNRNEKAVFDKFFDESLSSKTALVVVDSNSGKIIGGSRYCLRDIDGECLEIGWTFLAREFWGGKYNGELKSLMVNYGLKSFDRIIFAAEITNFRSQKALEKIGASEFKRMLWPPTPEKRVQKDYVVYQITEKL